MTHSTRILLFLLSMLTPAGLAAAQAKNAEAKADARAEARGNGSSSHSVTHRVVVVNGKKIVDERTENGRPVGRRSPGRGPIGRPAPALPPTPDAKEMLRRMRQQLERDLGRKLPLGGFDEPLPTTKPKREIKKATRSSRSSKARRPVEPKRRAGRLQPRRRLR